MSEYNTKRWLSIAAAQETTPALVRPWPPGMGGGPSRLNYCFTNHDLVDKLGAISREAVARWDDALKESSLVILPDPACLRERACLCDTKLVSPVTLRIEFANIRVATVGFRDFVMVPTAHSGDDRTRNFLKFGRSLDLAADVAPMAHEIGELS